MIEPAARNQPFVSDAAPPLLETMQSSPAVRRADDEPSGIAPASALDAPSVTVAEPVFTP